ncbi:MAG: branched-chain amino acid ABC transporter permease [Candidatus Kariarchaeaceae archaeon]|jgi:neutral amino acid transport system permease protein
MSKENQKSESLYSKLQLFFDYNRSGILSTLIAVPVLFIFLRPAFDPDTGTRYFIDSFAFVFLYAALALTLNLEVGYLGIPNFGKVAFVAIGAYSYAIVEDRNFHLLGLDTFFTGIIVATIVTGLAGILLTLPTLRLREDYLAIVTIVAGEIVRMVLNNEESLGGFSGFGVTNIFFQEYDVDAFMTGQYLILKELVFVIIAVSALFLIFRYYHSKYKELFPQNKAIKYALQKSITFAVIFSSVGIFLNFKAKITDEPSLSLDIIFMAIPTIIIVYKMMLDWKIRIKYEVGKVRMNIDWKIVEKIPPYVVFAFLAAIPILNYIIGLPLESETESKINNVNWYFMLVTLFVMLIVYVVMEEVYFSPFGRALRAIREDDTSAISVGKSLFNFRLRGLFLASALTGFVGAFYGMLLTNISPQTFFPLLTFQLYIMVIIGGSGNNKGVIFGAMIIRILIEATRRLSEITLYYPFFAKKDYLDWNEPVNPFNLALIVVGLLLILFLIYAPEGIFPEPKHLNERYTDMLYLNEEDPEKIADDKLLNALIRLSRSPLDPIPEKELKF